MKLIFILPLLLLEVLPGATQFNYNFQQNDYHIKFERFELVRYNKDYYKSLSVRTFKYNRTCAVANITYEPKVAYGYDLEVIVQAYKFMSNEYRYFPLRFEVTACKALKANMIGTSNLLSCGNFTGYPLMTAKVGICNWAPDTVKFPPLIPNGDYKWEMQGMYAEQEVVVVALYVSITRPITIT